VQPENEHLPIAYMEAAPRHSAAANVIDSGGKVHADSDGRRALESVIHSGSLEDTGQDHSVLSGCLSVGPRGHPTRHTVRYFANFEKVFWRRHQNVTVFA